MPFRCARQAVVHFLGGAGTRGVGVRSHSECETFLSPAVLLGIWTFGGLRALGFCPWRSLPQTSPGIAAIRLRTGFFDFGLLRFFLVSCPRRWKSTSKMIPVLVRWWSGTWQLAGRISS